MEEIILREKEQLTLIATAVEEAKSLGADGEELTKLTQLNTALFSKINLPGTKAQLKPVYSRRQGGHPRKLTKLTLVFKWGGEVRLFVTPTFWVFFLPTIAVHSFGTISISGLGGEYEERHINYEYIQSFHEPRQLLTVTSMNR
jgi:hypothetical protein